MEGEYHKTEWLQNNNNNNNNLFTPNIYIFILTLILTRRHKQVSRNVLCGIVIGSNTPGEDWSVIESDCSCSRWLIRSVFSIVCGNIFSETWKNRMRKSRMQPVALKTEATIKLKRYERVTSYIQPKVRTRRYDQCYKWITKPCIPTMHITVIS